MFHFVRAGVTAKRNKRCKQRNEVSRLCSKLSSVEKSCHCSSRAQVRFHLNSRMRTRVSATTGSLLARPYICPRCSYKLQQSSTQQRRWISRRYLEKEAAAKVRWDKQAEEVRAGKKQTFFKMLQERGYLHQVIGLVALLSVQQWL